MKQTGRKIPKIMLGSAIALTLFFLYKSIQLGNDPLKKLIFTSEPELSHYEIVASINELDNVKVCEIISQSKSQKLRGQKEVLVQYQDTLKTHPQDINLNYLRNSNKLVRITGKTESLTRNKLDSICSDRGVMDLNEETKLNYELIDIIKSGEPVNRIDVVFMSEGYTKGERSRFIEDIKRLSEDMFQQQTFSPLLPFFNILAVFIPSNESGIGINGKPRDTVFGLYRDGTELRGIYPTKPNVARRICNELKPYQCDYSSIIANDDFYGGLGGEFIISTRSPDSGTIVLRHEMGHTFDEVGEEYDGGQVYDGVNAAKSLDHLGWKHWLSDPKHVREEKADLLLQDYSWFDLSKGAYVLDFTSSGNFKRWSVQISTSGIDKSRDLKVLLDGKELKWQSNGNTDRQFYKWFSQDQKLSKGNHTLVFQAFNSPKNGSRPIHQLCNVLVEEYQDETQFKFGYGDKKAYVSAYPTFDYKKRKSYRPTNEFCLMRNMTSVNFCPVCMEGLWLQFLKRVSLVDSLKVRVHKHVYVKSHDYFKVQLKLIPFNQKYGTQSEIWSKNKYHISWYRNRDEVKRFKGKDKVYISNSKKNRNAEWFVKVKFTTPLVRLDKHNLLHEKVQFHLFN